MIITLLVLPQFESHGVDGGAIAAGSRDEPLKRNDQDFVELKDSSCGV